MRRGSFHESFEGGKTVKFLHLADLHFGKSIYGVSLLERGDQRAWVERFLELVQNLNPDAVVIAGDVYDRSAPSGDAVELLDSLVTALAEMGVAVMIVAGNHDSGQRLSFGGSLLAKQNVHIAGVPSKELTHVTLTDRDGPVTFWLMPYIFPTLVAQLLGDDEIRDYDTAVRRLLAAQNINFAGRNVLIAHQNVTADGREVQRGGSESMVGGVGQVDYQAFDGFDYVALGHIHSSYCVGRDAVRYAGSCMCYHFSETRQCAKGPILVELGAKGTPPVLETKVIPPLHPMREIRGAYPDIRDAELQNTARGEYVRIVLTDRKSDPAIYAAFRTLFEARDSILMELTSEYSSFVPVSGAPASGTTAAPVEKLFTDFYIQRCDNAAPTPAEEALLQFVGEQVRGTATDETLDAQIDALLKFTLEQGDAT